MPPPKHLPYGMPTSRRRVAKDPLLRAIAFGLSLAFMGAMLAVLSTPSQINTGSAAPHPSLDPQDVVLIQLNALRGNSSSNEGIAVAYRFASATNQQNTGPLFKFVSMLQSESYRTLLNHLSVEYGPVIRQATRSLVPVVVTDKNGQSSAYIWVLSQSTSNHCRSCWMTDAVIPAGELHQLRFA